MNKISCQICSEIIGAISRGGTKSLSKLVSVCAFQLRTPFLHFAYRNTVINCVNRVGILCIVGANRMIDVHGWMNHSFSCLQCFVSTSFKTSKIHMQKRLINSFVPACYSPFNASDGSSQKRQINRPLAGIKLAGADSLTPPPFYDQLDSLSNLVHPSPSHALCAPLGANTRG